ALSFSSDQNTGLYRIGSDNIGISCGGSKVVDISTSIPLVAITPGTAGTGLQIAGFGSTAQNSRIQFFDENTSTSTGPIIRFNAGNPGVIRGSGPIEFWPQGSGSSNFTVTSSGI